MRYMLLIYGDESAGANMTEAELQAEMEAYNTFTRKLREAGGYLSGEALHPTTSATTVQAQGGKVVTTDGPFAETKEQLGGFYMVEAASLDQAIEWASWIPGAQRGKVEVRPIVEWD